MPYLSRSKRATQQYAAALARDITGSYEVKLRKSEGAAVVALEGELGAGKTAFAQGFAAALGVKERVLSPTFIMMNIYDLPRPRNRKAGARPRYRHFVHIDCYRIGSPDELLHLGLAAILKDPDAIVLIEWADRIKKLLPPETVWMRFVHGGKSNERVIEASRSKFI
ncbi:MAG: tRNA (adenosine(37)-N6)-threonylcarbamoyltransferase complex ATPase subunit type 1 TsaE [Patescibacteria group bacterium]